MVVVYSQFGFYLKKSMQFSLWAVHGATELRVFTVVAFCAAWNGGGVL